jgi:hypothetical protein
MEKTYGETRQLGSLKSGELIGSIDTDEAGIGLVEFTPAGSAEIVMAVEAHDAQGNQTAKTFTLSLDPTPGSILLRTDRTLYAVGDVVRADLFVGGRGGSVYADVLEDGRTVFSRILEPRDGRASFVVPLSAELSGTLTLSVYRITLGSDTIRDRKIIYVDPAEGLFLPRRAVAHPPLRNSWLRTRDHYWRHPARGGG